MAILNTLDRAEQAVVTFITRIPFEMCLCTAASAVQQLANVHT